MRKPLVIFGTGKIAEVVSYFAEQECGYSIAAYAVDAMYITAETFLSKPVVPFEKAHEVYPPQKFDMFVAVGYHDLNGLREIKCADARKVGYQLVSVVSPNAHVPTNVVHGHNCFIMPPSIIHPCVKLGNNVFVWSGALIGHHSIIDDNCWFTSNCNIGGNVTIGKNCFIALNATVSHSINISRHCFLGANTLITKSLDAEKVVIADSSKPYRLDSKQFLKISSFTSL